MQLRLSNIKKLILILAFLLFQGSAYAYEEESKVICALTSKIAKFTQQNNSELNPYSITVFNNQFGDLCSDMYKNIRINNKNIQVLYIDNLKDLQPTNILFIFDTSIDELNEILAHTENKRILTISTMRGFVERGGMVQIYSQNQKLKIKINLDRVKQEQIYIHSALLRIATIVSGEEK